MDDNKKGIKEKFSMSDSRARSTNDQDFSVGMDKYFGKSLGSNMDKLRNFTKYVPRQALTNFLAKNEIFKHILGIHGYIIECGVFLGGGLMTWAEFSAIYEPYNNARRIVGFDTFTGFPGLTEKDQGNNTEFAMEGGLSTNAQSDILECIELYNLNRPISHIPRVEIVAGNAMDTIPHYIQDNPHLVVSLLYLDFDIYEPTKIALETFVPRMPKGSVIAFDELNMAAWPGETLAVFETVGIRNLKIQRFAFASALSYAVLD